MLIICYPALPECGIALEQELEQAGVTYLPKPFTPRDLLDAVRQAMQPFSLREKQLESVANAV
jgi:FixJ family two-component response regulator